MRCKCVYFEKRRNGFARGSPFRLQLTVMTPPNTAAVLRVDDIESIDWGVALREHDRWLRSIVYNRLGEPAAVEDVMQEIALAAVRQSSPIRESDKVAPWLYRLAIRQTLLYRRKMGRARNLTKRYADRVLPTDQDRSGSPLDWLLSVERGELVRRSLSRIRPEDAMILQLKYQQDLNYHEIAEKLGISHSAVEARLHRARSRFRKEITLAGNQ